MNYGICPDCLVEYKPVWFVEEEYRTTNDGHQFKTGRKRHVVDYLICPCCLKKQCVDDTFDGQWWQDR